MAGVKILCSQQGSADYHLIYQDFTALKSKAPANAAQ